MIVWGEHRAVLYPGFVYAWDRWLATATPTAPDGVIFQVTKGYVPRALLTHQSPHSYGCAVHLAPTDDQGHPTYDIRHPGWAWLTEHLQRAQDLRGGLRGRWWHVEWKRWTEVLWGLRSPPEGS